MRYQRLARRAPLIFAASLLPFELAFGLYRGSVVMGLVGWALHSAAVIPVGYAYVLGVEATLAALIRGGKVEPTPGIVLFS